MNILQRLQDQPESIRKIILWTVVLIVSLILVTRWLSGFKAKMQLLREESFIDKFKASASNKGLENLLRQEFPKF